MSALLAAAGWALALQALGLWLGLCGLHLLPRRAPRWLGGVAGLAAVLLWAMAVALSIGWGWAWILPATLPAGVIASLLLCVLVPRRPDRALVAAGATLTLEGEPDAGALTLGAGRGATVVLVHGGGNDRLYGLWYLAETLLQRGHGVITAHLPGHGRGGADRFTLEACRRRLDLLVRAAPNRPVVVLGQSLGGALALDQLARGEVELDGVVTVSAPLELNVGARVLGELRGLLGSSIYRALAYGNPWEVLPAGGGFKRGAFPVRVERGSYLEAFARAVQALELGERLPRRSGAAPVLLVHGMRDGVVPHEHARLLAEALGSGAELWIYPRVTHLDPLLDPQVVAEVVQFIDGVRA